MLDSTAAAAKKPRGTSAPSAKKATYVDWVEVVELEGRMTAEGRPVQPGFYAAPGVRLELEADGRAVFRLGKEGAFEMKGPATFAVNSGALSGLDLWRGRLLAALPRLKSPFHIHTRGLVASVRGTDLYMDLAGRNDLYLCVCQGTVSISDTLPRGYRKTVSAEHHQGLGYHRGGGSTLESDHEMAGHSDADLDALHAIVSAPK